MPYNPRTALRRELEAPHHARRWGSGWISGAAALVLSLAGLGAVLCMHFPDWLTTPQLRTLLLQSWLKPAVQATLLLAFALACLNIVLRRDKVLGFSATFLIICASALGVTLPVTPSSTNALGLDWFILNLLMTGVLFVPLEKSFPRLREQALFRREWREDLLYFFVGSLLVQGLTFLTLLPSQIALAHTGDWHQFRALVSSQPIWLQFIEIMFLTDFVQYWLHRAFHRVPFLWRFHAVHHSAKTMDWLAGSRMHLVEIVCLRGLTVIPMQVLGFEQTALYAYLVTVYLYATYVHANLRFDIEFIKPLLVTPRFHHWHHGIEPEAVDVNFAVHFPILDRLFGTYYMPARLWPSGYGVGGHPVPTGFMQQMLYPFQREKKQTS